MVFLTKEKIVSERLIHFVHSEKYGGIALFLGRVRKQPTGHHRSLRVVRIDYSAYREMALKKMRQIQKEVLQKWKKKGIGKVAIVHRIGKVGVGEISVAVSVSAVHRKEAFLSCHYAIDQIKKRVPIFKKEFFSDGRSVWVGCSD